MTRHINIPIFIPHLGCPNDCVFCNQRSISGRMSFDEASVRPEIENALRTVPKDCDAEIAFFGGSFTGIDRGLMIRLLETARSFIDDGRVSSIRLSTRPDYINEEILDILARYGVKTVELGIQSMDAAVLAASKRGHTPHDSERACRLVKEYGFDLVGQMMTGLPESTPEKEIYTAEKIVSLGADGARIYPTMVFKNTELEKMALDGSYTPPTLDGAVSRTAGVLDVFVRHGVPVIRIGLHSGETLYAEDGISMGEYHPAMGELVEGELYYNAIRKSVLSLCSDTDGKVLTVTVKKGELSKAIGQKKRNKDRLLNEFSPRTIVFAEDESRSAFSPEIKIE